MWVCEPLAAGAAPPWLGRAANNCTTCLSDFKHKCDIISITIKFASQVSSDLSSGDGVPPHVRGSFLERKM